MGIEPAVGGQQGRMNIDQPIRPTRHETCRQQPHETGKTNEFGAAVPQLTVEIVFETLPVGIVFVVHDAGFDACAFGARQALCIRDIGDDTDDLSRKIGLDAGIDQRLQIRSSTRDEDRDL